MARDAGLEELIRDQLEGLEPLRETTMFGGQAWLYREHLLCCARHDGVLVRLGRGNEGWALERPEVGLMKMGKRPMHGWVRVTPEGFGDDRLRRKLLDGAIVFVRALPEKAQS